MVCSFPYLKGSRVRYCQFTNVWLTLVEAGGRPALELHAQREATRGKNFLDFVERLATQVRGLEQLVLGALDQVTDVIDVLGLQAVGRAHRQFQFVDRAQQDRVELLRAALHRLVEGGQFAAFQLREHRELLDQDLGGGAHGVFGGDGAVGLDLDDQLVQVRALLDAGALDDVAHALDGRERRVEDDAANGLGRLVGVAAHRAGHVAAALLDLDLHVDLAALGQVGDDMVGIDDLDVVRGLDVGGGDDAFAVLAQRQGDLVAVVQLEDHALEVQQDADHVFLDAVDRRVLVQHAGDGDFS